MNSYPINFEFAIVPPYALNTKDGKTPTISGFWNNILNDKLVPEANCEINILVGFPYPVVTPL